MIYTFLVHQMMTLHWELLLIEAKTMLYDTKLIRIWGANIYSSFLKKNTSCLGDGVYLGCNIIIHEKNSDNYRDSFSYLNDPVLQLPYWNSKENYDNDDDTEWQDAISISKDNNPYSENYDKYTGSLQFGYVSEKAFYYPDPGVAYVPERDLNSHNPRNTICIIL